jgi:hypothetical protein
MIFHLENTKDKIKLAGINLINEIKDVYNEYYKTLIKEIEEDTENGDIQYSWNRKKINIFRYPYHPNQTEVSM